MQKHRVRRRNCSVEYDGESELSVPDRNIEPAVATTPGIPDVSIRKEKKLDWGAKELSKKGVIRFTYYEEGKDHPRSKGKGAVTAK